MLFYLSFFPLFFCVSCGAPVREIVARTTVRLEGKNTNIRDWIEIDGYYVASGDEGLLYTSRHMMFFEDGTYASGFSFKEGATRDSVRENMSGGLNIGILNNRLQWGHYWGVYRIDGDVIIVNAYWPPYSLRDWSFWEARYKIVNRTTVKPIYYRSLKKGDDWHYEVNGKSPWITDGTNYVFMPASGLPFPDNRMKEERWIWRNESDWRAYMDRLKGQQTPEAPKGKPKPPKTQRKSSPHEPPGPSSFGSK